MLQKLAIGILLSVYSLVVIAHMSFTLDSQGRLTLQVIHFGMLITSEDPAWVLVQLLFEEVHSTCVTLGPFVAQLLVELEYGPIFILYFFSSLNFYICGPWSGLAPHVQATPCFWPSTSRGRAFSPQSRPYFIFIKNKDPTK